MDNYKKSINKDENKPQVTQAKEKMKIDPKKLIIYSEIMKPKFDEGLE